MTIDPATPFPDVTVYTFGTKDPDRWYGDPAAEPTVVIAERGCQLHLHFSARRSGASLRSIELRPAVGSDTDPVAARHFFPQLELYLAVGRAAVALDFDGAREAAEALRQVGRPGRGLSDDFFRLIAIHHNRLVDEGERHPVKALAESYVVTISTASRWISGARLRGYLPPKPVAQA